MDIFLIGTQAECESYIEKMDAMMGYPNPPTKTNTYAILTEYFSKRGTYFIPIKSVWGPKLGRQITVNDMDSISTTKEKGNRKTRDELVAGKAFPVDPLEI